MSESSEKKFFLSILPWIVAVGALLAYALTLNHWVSLDSLGTVARIVGWDWRDIYVAPLHFLVTLPFRLLPHEWQPLALNFVSAICAALSLGLLAHSVRLLPHDRTREQRHREPSEYSLLSIRGAWLPPVMAVLVCAFQLSFWENATTATTEMLDLLIFAYVIRCLLEFRISQNERWLSKLAFVYGLGVTNNWAMIGYFPLFLTALIWIKGLSFFDLRFFVRMIGWGTAGLTLYLLLPSIAFFSGHDEVSFYQALKTNLSFEKSYTISNPFIRVGEYRWEFFTLTLTSLFPILMMGIRWPSFNADMNPAAATLASIMFHFLHLAFLVFGLWLFFDPKFSGRVIGRGYVSFLTFYYLAALSIGYLAGYVMLVFGREPEKSWQRSPRFLRPIHRTIALLIWPLLVAVPVGLLYQNFPVIHVANGPAISRFAERMTDALPSKGAVILSDDPSQIILLEAAFERQHKRHENLLLETSSLSYPLYHRRLHKLYPAYGPSLLKLDNSTNVINQVALLDFMISLSKKYEIYYLHPSFGYYFERFYMRPQGLVCHLKPYEADAISPPPLTSEEISRNENFWTKVKEESLDMLPKFSKKNMGVSWLSNWYSRGLNYWGVEMQKLGKLGEAHKHFSDAIRFNPENVTALINQRFNEQLRKGGDIGRVQSNNEITKKLGRYRTLDLAIRNNGPFDELEACFQLGQVFTHGGNIRQGMLYYLRVLELKPDHTGTRLALISSYLQAGFADKALEAISQVRQQSEKQPLDDTGELALTRLEAQAYLTKNDVQLAEQILLKLKNQKPDDERIANLLVEFYMVTRRNADASYIVHEQLKDNPDNPTALLNESILQIAEKNYEKGIAALDHLLKLQPDHIQALMYRAMTNFQIEKYAEAKRDYEAIEKKMPGRVFAVYYGLGKIADRTKNIPEAIRNYKLYLKHAQPGTEEYKQIETRLKELEAGQIK